MRAGDGLCIAKGPQDPDHNFMGCDSHNDSFADLSVSSALFAGVRFIDSFRRSDLSCLSVRAEQNNVRRKCFSV
jgi:hypothetical protein